MNHRYKLFLLSILLMSQLNSFGLAIAGDIIIKGTVTAKVTGETLVGVNVSEVNAENRVVSGTVTDLNGQYIIKIKSMSNKLVFSYVGFKKQVMVINGSSSINVAMEEESHELETVNITAKKVSNTGALTIPTREISTAMQRISTQEFEGVQVTSIDEALQGRIAGMDIVANSGDPGSGTTMRIRGASSINANNPPLIVINGIPLESSAIDQNFNFANANQEQYANMLSINPDDVEDITVLKDAASTAIWGSKGANGVIQITTKKGKRGPTSISYTYRFTRSVQPKGLNMLNGGDYTMMMKQAKFNPAQSERAANVNEYNYDPSFSEYENYNNNTDWVDEVTQTGFIHDHYISATGGGERATYRVSGGFFTQTGTVIGQKLGRFSSRAILDYSVSDRLKFTTEFSFSMSDNDRNYENLLGIAYAKMPNVSVYAQDANGNNTDVYYNILTNSGLEKGQKYLKNPVALADLATNNLKNYRITPTFRIQYDILPRLQTLVYNMYVSFDMNNNKTSMFLPREATNLPYEDKAINKSESSDIEDLSVQTENSLVWRPKFSSEDHSLQVLASFQATTGRSSPLVINSYGYSSSQIVDATAAGNIEYLASKGGQWRSLAFLGNLHYAYKGKYIVGLAIRRDGSTKFGKDKKFGDFPGISAKWIVSDESFMKSSQNWLSMLAIRPSWGVSGNAPSQDFLQYSRYATYGNYINLNATKPSSLELATLRWEKSTTYNLGMDLGFFGDKFVFDLNYYFRRTEDLLQKNQSLPSTSGYSSFTYQNVGTIDNQGWEVNFYANKVLKINDFSMNFTFNLANNKNTIVSLNDNVLASLNGDYSYKNGIYLSRIQEGNSYGSIYGFKYNGVYQYDKYIPGEQESAPFARNETGAVIMDNDNKPLPMVYHYRENGEQEYTFRGGDAKYEDINHDGSIDELDIVYIGNANTKLNGGFSTTFVYKRFSVNAFFNFRIGNKIINAARMDAENMYGDNNQSIAVNYRWRKDGDETTMPRALYQYGFNWLGSDRYVEDGSFLRFKDLTCRYSLSNNFASKLYIKKVDFYLTINNLFVFTKYTGVDPEVGYDDRGLSIDGSKTPRSKGFTFGLTVGL